MTFFPEAYAARKSDEIILHEDDNRLDFRPHKLRLGTQSENAIDAHTNGKHDDTKCARKKCASYVDDVLEKEYDSQMDAAKYLKIIGWDKAAFQNISMALNPRYSSNFAYGRTWKLST
jgi:hypothetical protein